MPKTVVITGATSGIGRAVALAHARLGANVAISGRREEQGNQAAREIVEAGGSAFFLATDVQHPADIERFINSAADKFGAFDTLITNAGIEPPRSLPLADIPVEQIDAVLDTNLRGSLITIKYGLAHLRKPGGDIILVSSLWGRNGGAALSVYTATKAGVEGLTRALAVELGHDGIRVNCLAPGFIDTEMSRRFMGGGDFSPFFTTNVPLERIGLDYEIANAMTFLSSDAASYITGQTLTVDGGHSIKMSAANFQAV
ncbi:SDR family NAD(P)-dependent oxidoreductase [Rhizobium leguminosarum]|uniref:SDR family NAD(P)-dependent oxidoreductase n=1 Tax=Rhizobium TaxID=379 RepID=UPI0013EE7D41|nr:SDR family NAD(P)-dependent oxidoreductase [Rhizobium leguminosarum]